jgi:hypothetical protein
LGLFFLALPALASEAMMVELPLRASFPQAAGAEPVPSRRVAHPPKDWAFDQLPLQALAGPRALAKELPLRLALVESAGCSVPRCLERAFPQLVKSLLAQLLARQLLEPESWQSQWVLQRELWTRQLELPPALE